MNARDTATAKAVFIVDPTYFAKYPVGIPPVPTLVCRYNPTSVKVGGGGQWTPEETSGGDKPNMSFTKSSPRTLSLTLLVDQFGLPAGNVAVELKALSDWSTARYSPLLNRYSAPWLRFQWGVDPYFLCVLESYDISYTMFGKSGSPLRAEASLSLKEKRDYLPFQNPTSGGLGGERYHVTTAGDSLHSIAHRYYGKPSLWRGLATFNNIDDPMRVPSGVPIALPATTVIEAIS